MKSLFEQMGGTYSQQGDYLIPHIILPNEEKSAYWYMGTATPTLFEATPQGALHQPFDKRKAE